MRWLADAARGDWLKARIDTTWRAPFDMHSVVPRGFDAYVRILHPVPADRPLGDDWRTLESPWSGDGEIENRLGSWQEVATACGTIGHPLMQWHRITRQPLDGNNEVYDAAGWRFSSPQQGQLESWVLADVASVLAGHTATPDAGAAGVWCGWGGLSMAGAGPMLKLPQREHVLVEAGIREFATEKWPTIAPWVHNPSWAESPSLIWPEDHAWVLVTEVDFDSTVVAGSRALVEELVKHPLIEAYEIPEGADLSSEGDRINPAG